MIDIWKYQGFSITKTYIWKDYVLLIKPMGESMSNSNVEKWTLEDGRRAERRVSEVALENGQQERVVELHVEDERPLRLQQRIVERSRPIIYERTLETVDPKTGKVIEQKVEAIEPRVQMQVVEHIKCSGKKCSGKCSAGESSEVNVEQIVEKVMQKLQPPAERYQEPLNTNEFQSKLNSLGLVNEVGGRVEETSNLSLIDKVMLGVIAAQIAGLVYIVFFM